MYNHLLNDIRFGLKLNLINLYIDAESSCINPLSEVHFIEGEE